MSFHNVTTDIVLIYDGSYWLAWCPNVDVCTQGDNPEHALGMAADMIRHVFEDDLDSFIWSGHPEDQARVPKSVHHPLRRGREDHVRTDEHWQDYEDFTMKRGDWSQQTCITLDELTGDFGAVIVLGNTSVVSRGGIVHALPSINDLAMVRARSFHYLLTETVETRQVAAVPTALLDRHAPLRRSGMSVEGVVLLWINGERKLGKAQVCPDSIREMPARGPDRA